MGGWRGPLLAALALLALTLAAAAPFLNVPMQRDQGVYAACGSILLHGGAPYLDCWDTKAPLTHYTYALAQLLFGIRPSGPVALSAFMAGLTGLAIWRLARPWWGDGLSWSAGAFYSLLLVSIPFDMNAQSEGFANLVVAGGIWALMAGYAADRRWLRVLAGAAFALAFGYKYTILLPAALAGLAVLISAGPGRKLSAWPGAILELASGFGLTLAAACGYLAWRGALPLAVEHLMFMLTEFPKVAVNPTLLLFPGESGPPLFYWQRTVEEFLRLPVLHLAALAGVAWGLARKQPWALLLALWLAAALASVYPQKVMTLYHWTLSLPPLVLGTAALGWELRRLGLRAPRWQTAASWLLAVLAVGNLGLRFYQDQWLVSRKYLTGQQSLMEFYTDQATGDEIKVAEYVKARTNDSDLVWVWGNHSIIYYWADRRSPTRFIFNSPLMAAIGPNDYQPRWKNEVLAALQARPPVYIVMTYWDRTWFDYENPFEQFAKLPGYQAFLDKYYRRETGIDRFVLYRLTPWWSRYNYPGLLDSVTAVDLLSRLGGAVLKPSPNDPIQRVDFKLYDEPPQPTLLMHPEGSAAFQVAVPPGVPCFRADLAMDPQSWGWGGDGANFRLAVNGETLLDRYVGNQSADRFWQPVIVDLSRWAGQNVTLTLSTGPGPNSDFTGDLAGWGLPRIVSAPGAACDAAAIIR